MSLLIATPCYASNVTLPFMQSCLRLQESLLEARIPFDFLFTGNESLITRARNTSVATFLKTDYDALMFIDSDIEFSPQDVADLWNMETDIACAAYSMKRLDKPVSAWKDGSLVELPSLPSPSPVDYAGTGFLMLRRNVFLEMQKAYPELKHTEGKVGECWGFFDCMYDGEGEDKVSLSEDYAFCKRARDIGFEIILDPKIKLTHYGMYGY